MPPKAAAPQQSLLSKCFMKKKYGQVTKVCVSVCLCVCVSVCLCVCVDAGLFPVRTFVSFLSWRF